jgi:hypothetical protein
MSARRPGTEAAPCATAGRAGSFWMRAIISSRLGCFIFRSCSWRKASTAWSRAWEPGSSAVWRNRCMTRPRIFTFAGVPPAPGLRRADDQRVDAPPLQAFQVAFGEAEAGGQEHGAGLSSTGAARSTGKGFAQWQRAGSRSWGVRRQVKVSRQPRGSPLAAEGVGLDPEQAGRRSASRHGRRWRWSSAQKCRRQHFFCAQAEQGRLIGKQPLGGALAKAIMPPDRCRVPAGA